MIAFTWEHKSEVAMQAFIVLLLHTLVTTSAQDPCVDSSNGGPCKRTPGSCRPKVTVDGTNNLMVDWTNIFAGCESSHMKAVKVHFKTTGGNVNTKDVSIDQKQVSILANPCLQHEIFSEFELKFDYFAEHEVDKVRSLTTNYNSADSTDPDYPYSGLLTSVASDICLKENGTVILPSPPSPLRNCIIQTGEQKSPALKRPGDSGTVSISFSNPSAPPTSTDIEVSKIRKCLKEPASTTPITPTKTTTCAPTQTCPECTKPDDQSSDDQSSNNRSFITFLILMLIVSLAMNILCLSLCCQSLKTGKHWFSSYFSKIGNAIFGKARLEDINLDAAKKSSSANANEAIAKKGLLVL